MVLFPAFDTLFATLSFPLLKKISFCYTIISFNPHPSNLGAIEICVFPKELQEHNTLYERDTDKIFQEFHIISVKKLSHIYRIPNIRS